MRRSAANGDRSDVTPTDVRTTSSRFEMASSSCCSAICWPIAAADTTYGATTLTDPMSTPRAEARAVIDLLVAARHRRPRQGFCSRTVTLEFRRRLERVL